MESQQEQQSSRDQNQQVDSEKRQQNNSEQRQQNRGDQAQSRQRQEFEPAGQRQQTQPMQPGNGQNSGGLMGSQEMQKFSTQWTSVQAAFVDEPRKPVFA